MRPGPFSVPVDAWSLRGVYSAPCPTDDDAVLPRRPLHRFASPSCPAISSPVLPRQPFHRPAPPAACRPAGSAAGPLASRAHLPSVPESRQSQRDVGQTLGTGAAAAARASEPRGRRRLSPTDVFMKASACVVCSVRWRATTAATEEWTFDPSEKWRGVSTVGTGKSVSEGMGSSTCFARPRSARHASLPPGTGG